MKHIWVKVKAWFFMMWRPLLIFFGVVMIVGSILGFQLGQLTNGISAPEQAYIASVDSGKKLLNDPIYVIHKLPVYALFKLDVKNIAAYRAVSTLFATLAVVSCFFILREWYTLRVAVLGSWLFLTSAWILHVSRSATPEASFLLIMPLLWVAVWLYTTTLRKSAIMVLAFCSALCVYIPGFVWLLVIAGVWKRKHLWKELRQVPKWYMGVCVGAMLIVILPLILASINAQRELLLSTGLPTQLPNLKEVIQNLINIPGNLFVRGPNDATKWLGRLPLLDLFSSMMLVIGIYSLRYHLKLIRIQLLAGSALLLTVLIATGGLVTITALLPIVYILIAAGIAFMLQQWFVVFPLNPIARTIATTLMSIVVLLVSYYHISHYFIAWPQTPATRAVFSQSLLK